MRRTRIVIACFMIVAVLAACRLLSRSSGAQRSNGKRVAYYVDPMHPSYRSSRPGIAPDCGMPLSPVYADAEQPSSEPKDNRGVVRVDASTQEQVGIRVVSAELTGERRTLRVAGRVVPEDTNVFSINSGTDGFIRETWQDSVGMLVKKDQKLANYYAPDFIAAASGFLAASERIPGSVTSEGARSIQNYEDRLRNLGMSDLQIKHLAESRQLPKSIDIVSPVSGVILARNISPGQHFGHDTTFYQVADLSRVWVVAEVFEQDRPLLREGMTALIAIPDGSHTARARVTASLPRSSLTASSLQIRLEAENPRLVLRPDMRVSIQFPVSAAASVTVPADAVLDSGARRLIYVERADGSFEPRIVETGWQTGDQVEIRKGLQVGERVATGATFLMDSESRLRSAFAPAPIAP